MIFFSPVQDKKQETNKLIKKGFDLIEEAKYGEAIILFEKVLKVDKNCKEAYLGKGIAYYKSGNYDTRKIYPEEFIKKAIKIDKNYLEAKIHLGWAYYHKEPGDPELWGKYFNELVKNDPVDSETLLEISKLYNKLDNYYYLDYKRRIFPYLKKAYSLRTNNPETCCMLGWEYFIRNQPGKALKLYNEGILIEKSTPDYKTYLDIQQQVNLDLYKRFAEEGIEFAYPTQTLFVEKTTPTTEP